MFKLISWATDKCSTFDEKTILQGGANLLNFHCQSSMNLSITFVCMDIVIPDTAENVFAC